MESDELRDRAIDSLAEAITGIGDLGVGTDASNYHRVLEYILSAIEDVRKAQLQDWTQEKD